MNLREALKYLRDTPGGTVNVSLGMGVRNVDGMKGPKTIRWNAETKQFEGKRNREYSALDKHWTVLTGGSTSFVRGTTAAPQGAAVAAGGVEGAVRNLVDAIRAEIRA